MSLFEGHQRTDVEMIENSCDCLQVFLQLISGGIVYLHIVVISHCHGLTPPDKTAERRDASIDNRKLKEAAGADADFFLFSKGRNVSFFNKIFFWSDGFSTRNYQLAARLKVRATEDRPELKGMILTSQSAGDDL